VSETNIDNLASLVKNRAQEFGADMAGTVSLEDLKRSPSHEICKKIPEFDGVGTEDARGQKRGIVKWPERARSAIVIALEHPIERPEMDWWLTTGAFAGNTAGNRLLMNIVSHIAAWLEKEHGIQCFKLPYHIEHGGVYMKDAAVLAGLGCIGKNNLLLTPQYGPRVRLRVMLTDADLPSAGAAVFDPCEDCPIPCRAVCPQNAFAEKIYSIEEYEQEDLPGRSGVYDRLSCNQQMLMDESNFVEVKTGNQANQKKIIKYCRECEMACPVGLK
jgi:epoxyqueuosine reductase